MANKSITFKINNSVSQKKDKTLNDLQFEVNKKLFLNFISAISYVATEVNLEFTKRDLVCQEIDDGRICLITAHLNVDDLDDFIILPPEIKLSINLDDLIKAVNNAKTDYIKIEYNPQDKFILISNDNKYKSKVDLIQKRDTGIKPEALEGIAYSNNFEIRIDEFENIINMHNVFSETSKIIVDPSDSKPILMSAEGIIGNVLHIIEEPYLRETDFQKYVRYDYPDPAENEYAIEYEKNIIKGAKELGEFARIYQNEQTPMKLRILFGLNLGSRIDWYIAPRIEESSDDDIDEEYDGVTQKVDAWSKDTKMKDIITPSLLRKNRKIDEFS